MKPYVHLKGKGHEHTTIKKSTVTNGLINIDTACNSSTLQMEDLLFDLGEGAAHIINSTGTSMYLNFGGCRFYGNVASVFAYKHGANSAGNTVSYTGCKFNTSSSSYAITLMDFGSAVTTTDTYRYTNCQLLSKSYIGAIGGASSACTVYFTAVDCLDSSGDLIQATTGATVYITGGTWGDDGNNRTLKVTGGTITVTGTNILGGSGSNLIAVTSGTLNMQNCETKGGANGLVCSGTATSNLKHTSFAKSGAGVDLQQSDTATVNVTFCKYATTGGTITKVNEDVDLIDGIHASATATADKLLPLDSSGDFVNTAGDIISKTAGPAKVIVHDTTDGNEAALERADAGGEAKVANTASKPGTTGNALMFDGTNEYCKVLSDASIDNKTLISIDCIIDVVGYGGSNQGRILEKVNGAFNKGWRLNFNSGRLLFLMHFDGNTGWWQSAANSVTSGSKYHIVITYDRSSASNKPIFYIDSVVSATSVGGTPTGSSDSDAGIDLYIGNRASASRGFNGSIDELKLYDDIRTQSEVTTSYNSGSGIYGSSGDNLILGMHFDESSGTAVDDYSGNTNDGVLTNMEDADWVTGTVNTPGTDQTRNIVSSEDGVGASEVHRRYFGDKTNYDGTNLIVCKTLEVKPDNVLEATFDSSGLKLKNGVAINGILDEDDMASDSATSGVSQQSNKAYADLKIAKALLTTEGDIIYRNATVPARLAKGAALSILQMNSGQTAPEWATDICRIKTGTYTGDGTTGQAITGVGFQPKWVMIWVHSHFASEVTSFIYSKADITWGDYCFIFGDPNSTKDNRINSLDSDGFTIDDDALDVHPNANTVAYDYLAWG